LVETLFSDKFNAWPLIPPSSNPFQLFLDYQEIVRSNDVKNPKFIAHIRGVRRGIHKRLHNPKTCDEANDAVRAMGIHAAQPYLAILEVETYLKQHHPAGGTTIAAYRLPPSKAGSPTSVEYLVTDVQGPSVSDSELHLEKLHF
jgi:hypothetical protein